MTAYERIMDLQSIDEAIKIIENESHYNTIGETFDFMLEFIENWSVIEIAERAAAIRNSHNISDNDILFVAEEVFNRRFEIDKWFESEEQLIEDELFGFYGEFY